MALEFSSENFVVVDSIGTIHLWSESYKESTELKARLKSPKLPESVDQFFQTVSLYRVMRPFVSGVLIFLFAVVIPWNVSGQDLNTSRRLFETGKYEQCIAACEKGIVNAWRIDWRLLKIESELRIGQYKKALESAEEALDRNGSDIRVLWLARKVYQLNNDLESAEKMLVRIDQLARSAPWRYSDAEDRIVLGQMMLEANADARKVLELFFDQAKKVQPGLAHNYIVAADLALSKNDFEVAAKECEAGLKLHPQDAELLYRMGVALWSSDREKASEHLQKALVVHPKHSDTFLFQISRLIDLEEYDDAVQKLDDLIKINPRHELAHAYLAVVAHLTGDFETEKAYRKKALSSWSKNPDVDYTIGKKLSQKYRFREGAAYQRLALEFAPDFVPAKIQLAQDLLRLGQEDEGWALVSQANELDQYNALMHNLQTLHDEIASYESLESDGLIVRMTRREAALYGPEVMALLKRAKMEMCQRYDYQFDQPVIVEIFPRQSDFAIRTFGLPGGEGFLGVCFGHLITANSPASQLENPTNWKSVLWHEFCHAVTLGKTRNRMPRWLSEGISVYEERLRNPGSGEKISPTYRKMLLNEELTPVSQLSAAFLKAKSPIDLQFAYYESSLVIEFLLENYGQEILNKILVDLGAGIEINETLQRYSGSLNELDEKFREYAVKIAEGYAAEVDFETPSVLPNSTLKQLQEYLQTNERNYSATQWLVVKLMESKQLVKARELLEEMIARFDEKNAPTTMLKMLAAVYRADEDQEKELMVLNRIAKWNDDDPDVYDRLMEIHSKAGHWKELASAARKNLAVNPLRVGPHQQLATAGRKLNQPEVTLRALECLLEFKVSDVAETHFQIASVAFEGDDHEKARRHVLMALEEAPRFRAAHRLLYQLRQVKPAEATETIGSQGQQNKNGTNTIVTDLNDNIGDSKSVEEKSLKTGPGESRGK